MAAGTLDSYTFTPAGSGRCTVACTFEVEATASDWGSNVVVSLRRTISSTTTTGKTVNPPGSRQQMILLDQFDVTGGVACEVDLYCSVSGATACSAWNISFHVEVIKR